MKKSTDLGFVELIKNSEKDLQKIRNIYFPAIADGIITGYNLYPFMPNLTKGKLFLNYLHSDLKEKDKHLKEINQKLEREGLIEKRIIINNELVNKREIINRNADYITNADWTDPIDMRYFTFDGEQLSLKEAKEINKSVIGESLQYDLLIRAENESELRKLINIFKKYTSKYKLSYNGRKIQQNGKYKLNKEAITNSWDIPLLIVTSMGDKKPKNLKDFLKINHFSTVHKLGKTPVNLSTLVSNPKSKEFAEFLVDKGITKTYDKRYALRVFIEDYINT